MDLFPKRILFKFCILQISVASLFIACKKEDQIYNDQENLVVSVPKAGAVLEKGESYSIKWITEKAEKLRIDLYKQDKPVSIISVSENNSGNFTWLVPHNIAPDTNYRIRITGIDNKEISGFSHFFIISGDPTSKFIKSSSFYYNNWIKGSDSIISWTDNIDEEVRIDLFLNGVFYSNIAESTPSIGNFPWSIPGTLPTSSNYSFKISSVINPSLYSISDFFRISLNSEMNMVKNANFVSTNYWNYSNPSTESKNRWNINNNIQAAEVVSLQSSGSIVQELGLVSGLQYKIVYTLSKCNGYIGGSNLDQGASIVCHIGDSTGVKRYREGTYTDIITGNSSAISFKINLDLSSNPGSGFICTLDNVEVYPE